MRSEPLPVKKYPLVLQSKFWINPTQRSGRAVYCTGLENRRPFTRSGGSNPSSSAPAENPAYSGIFCFLTRHISFDAVNNPLAPIDSPQLSPMKKPTTETVDQYIQQFPVEIQRRLESIKACICKAAPAAIESISYGMPAYKLNGKPLVYFAGYEHHIGFYGTPFTHTAFAKQLAKFKQGKGSVQFPHTQKLPVSLIKAMIEFRSSALAKTIAQPKRNVASKAKKISKK